MDKDLISKYKQLLTLLGQVDDLNRSSSVLSWDKHTYMPKEGAKWRSVQMTSLTTMAHERFTSDETGRLLEALIPYAMKAGESCEARIIKTAARKFNDAKRLPLSFIEEKASVINAAYFGWLKAREANSFQAYVPFLEKLVEIHLKQAGIVGYEKHVLDPLIDEMEGGFGAEEIEKVFEPLRAALPKIVKKIREEGRTLRLDFLERDFPYEKQIASSKEGMKRIGFDFTRGRVDEVVHPFCSSFSPDDVRVTTRVTAGNPLSCFFSCMHEGGHGLYNLGIPDRYFRTPVYDGASSGIHESQSRLWENVIGRSRNFWLDFYPRYQEIFHEQLFDVSIDEWYYAVNRVKPTYIRTEADEVTYNLHIMMRFELEKAVMDGDVKVSELEELYNSRVASYFGLPAPDPVNGIIQDIHWTEYFGTSYQGYTIGNIAGVQFMEAAKRADPQIAIDIENAHYENLYKWLKDNMYIHGAYYKPQELMQVVTGKVLDSTEYLDYIKTKYGEVYDVDLGDV